jgi:hypothetical protein
MLFKCRCTVSSGMQNSGGTSLFVGMNVWYTSICLRGPLALSIQGERAASTQIKRSTSFCIIFGVDATTPD